MEKGLGIWLGKEAGAPDLSGGLVFDLNQRQFRTNNRAVLTDAPAQGAWKVTINQDKKGVTVVQGPKAMPPVCLPENVLVTAAQLRPAAQGLPDVLAVAYTELAANRPLILLCNPADGKPYRLLTGHRQSILGLAFSASRPLLASVGDDQTVCVWSLADVNNAVGEVPGLGVSDKVGKNGNEVVVRSVEAGSAAAAKLAAGDVLHKLGAPGGKARAIKDAVGFLLEVYQRQPGDAVEVTVAGKGVVTLKVQRGVDWRNPLFSLFLKDNLDWVGWSPAGPVRLSGRRCRGAAGLAHQHRRPGSPSILRAGGRVPQELLPRRHSPLSGSGSRPRPCPQGVEESEPAAATAEGSPLLSPTRRGFANSTARAISGAPGGEGSGLRYQSGLPSG